MFVMLGNFNAHVVYGGIDDEWWYERDLTVGCYWGGSSHNPTRDALEVGQE